MILAPGVGLDSEKNPEVPTEGTETSLKEGEKKDLNTGPKGRTSLAGNSMCQSLEVCLCSQCRESRFSFWSGGLDLIPGQKTRSHKPTTKDPK